MQRRSIDKLRKQLNELETHISRFESVSTVVSQASIGWHIEHSLLVLTGVVYSLNVSDPSTFERKFNLKKHVIFLLGRFPRGKARAPKTVRPTEEISLESLENHVIRAKEAISQLPKLPTDAFFKHPIFGDIRLKETIYFMELHTEHHLKIIRAI